jgi:hypothetical protein
MPCSDVLAGWAYYNMGIFIDTSQTPPWPKIGLELFRESYEDYEYLWLANGNTGYPRVDEASQSIF